MLVVIYLALIGSVFAFMTTYNIPWHSSQTTVAHSSHTKLNTALLSANQVVANYYTYIAENDVQAASQFLTAKIASLYRSSPDSDFNNVASISDLVVSKPYDIRLDENFRYEVQVDVTYTAQYKQTITVPNGKQTRFIYLGRNSTNEPWVIISIGTGP